MKYLKHILIALLVVCLFPIISDAKSGIRPYWWWQLDDTITSSLGGLTGTFTHAGTNRTRVNPATGLIEAVGANVARFENVGGHLALLCEPAGTNLCTYSEIFRAALGDWTQTYSTITDNATTAPDGNETADKIVLDDTAAIDHNSLQAIAKESFTDEASVTYSIYIKPNELTWVRLSMKPKVGALVGAYFNLSTGAVGTESVDSYGSEEMSDGWWRYWITHNIGTGIVDPIFYVLLADGDESYILDGDGTSGIYIWGAQVEESPVPTSLVYTAGAAVTRATESGEPHWTLPANPFNAEGTVIIWWRPGYAYDTMELATSFGLLTPRDHINGILRNDRTGGGGGTIYSYDGTNNVGDATNWSANTWYKLVVQWGYDVGGTEKFQIGVDTGTGISWGGVATFDGAYTLGSYLRIGYDLFSRMHVRQLMLFRKALSDTMINHYTGSP